MNWMIWWSTPKATVGLIVRGGYVVDCPPYARRWTLGRPIGELLDQAVRTGVTLHWLPDW